MTSLLIGSTGYVGSKISQTRKFDFKVHRSDLDTVSNSSHDFLICSGLPATKWLANANPESDWKNVKKLASTLRTISAENALLISTIDVYQPSVGVSERDGPNLDGPEAYGTNRAWFESFFLQNFPSGKVLRLPGLFSIELRKNFVFDLLNDREEHFRPVSPDSEFQFMNLEAINTVIDDFYNTDARVLNICSEPIKASDIAEVFGQQLYGTKPPIKYDVSTCYSIHSGANGKYTYSRNSIIDAISALKDAYSRQ
jgi:hypothetical protein